MGYILLLAAPNFYITKKRFKNYSSEFPDAVLPTLFSRIFLLICMLDILFVLGIVVMGVFSYLPGAGQSV